MQIIGIKGWRKGVVMPVKEEEKKIILCSAIKHFDGKNK